MWTASFWCNQKAGSDLDTPEPPQCRASTQVHALLHGVLPPARDPSGSHH